MGKKKKKLRKDAGGALYELPFDHLIGNGKSALQNGKARDAIEILKVARKRFGKSNEVNHLLFRAYLMRERQLREKKMISEADAIKNHIKEYLPAFESLSEYEDIKGYFSIFSNKDAVDIYANYVMTHSPSSKMEGIIANRILNSEEWDILSRLNENVPIRRDAVLVQQAISLMDIGKWEDALEILRSIPHSSPFSGLRIFCRAMAYFYAEDDKNALKALSMIPDDFPLSGVVNSLKTILANKGQNEKASAELKCLWDSPIYTEEDIRQLFNNIEEKQFRQAEEFIRSIADSVYPDDPNAARSFILELIWNMTNERKLREYEFEDMAYSLLPELEAKILIKKVQLTGKTNPFVASGEYIALLDSQFNDAESRNIAHSIILHNLINTILENMEDNRIIFNLEKQKIRNYEDILGIKSGNIDMAIIEMALYSIQLDQHNRKGYEILVKLPRTSRPAKKAVETALISMSEHFHDDPYPYLELASLYYTSNAFRKAETVLEEAMKRAPHDARVLDRYTLSFLISAEKNITRKKYHLAEKDIDRAEQVKSKRLALFIIEKRILLHILINSSPFSTSFLKERGDFDRLRTLSYLLVDIRRQHITNKKNIIKDIEAALDHELKSTEKLSSSEIVRLLMPIEKEFAQIVPVRNIAEILLKRSPEILRRINITEIVPLYDVLLEPNVDLDVDIEEKHNKKFCEACAAIIRKDIDNRLKYAKDRDCFILKFYKNVIDHLTQKNNDSEPFYNIINICDSKTKQELTGISRKLSKYAVGDLKEALETFNFNILDYNIRVPNFFFDDDDDDDDGDDDYYDYYEDDDDDDDYDGQVEEILKHIDSIVDPLKSEKIDEIISVEVFIEAMKLRGAPESVIFEMVKNIRKSPTLNRDFSRIAKQVEKTGNKDKISREARLLLFGKEK